MPPQRGERRGAERISTGIFRRIGDDDIRRLRLLLKGMGCKVIHLPNGMTILTKRPPIVFRPNRALPKPPKPPMPTIYTVPAGPPLPPRTVREYIKLECYASGVSVGEVYGKTRTAEIVRIRQRAMHYAVKRLGMPLTKVGRILKRDHTTVLHGVRAVEAQLNG